jgi:hypothetical protein
MLQNRSTYVICQSVITSAARHATLILFALFGDSIVDNVNDSLYLCRWFLRPVNAMLLQATSRANFDLMWPYCDCSLSLRLDI